MYDQIAANKRKTIVLMFCFFVFAAAVAWLIGAYFNDFGYTVFALVFSLFYALWSYFGSARLAIAMNGAKQISKKDDPRFWRIVENLAITDGLPMPKVYIIDDPAPNAFATGRNYNTAVVAATTGLLDIMNDTELEGVVAHELGHVKNYDIRVSMVAFALVTVVGLLADIFLRMSFFGSRDDDNNNGGLLQVLGLVAIVLAPIVATVIQLAISRRREFLADATGALTTRYPDGLASALTKLKLQGTVLRRQNTSTAHLFIANPLSGKSLATLFSTHPSIDERIKRLHAMDNSA